MARNLASSGGLVLLVGHHVELPNEARWHLEEHYQLVRIGNQALSIAWLETHVPDLVIADAAGIHDYWLCRAIAHRRSLACVSILLISTNANEAWVRALQEGADDCMPRPIDARRFGVRVENLVARSRRIRGWLETVSPSPETQPAAGKGSARAFLAYSGDPLLQRMDAAISSNVDNPQFNARSLARAMAMGRASLYRRLQALGGLSPGRFILERRLQHAAALFGNGQTSVTEVAYAVGFKSLSHFSRSFRKYHGVTPIAYLKSGRSSQDP